MNAVSTGAVAGFIATLPMTVVMAASKRWFAGHRRRPQPPYEITRELTRRATDGAMPEPATMARAATAVHFGVGASAGALYGSLAPRLPGPALVKGMAYGAAVWAVGYGALLPPLRLEPPVARQPPSRNGVMLVSHLVWGACLGLLHEAFFTNGAFELGRGRRSRSDAWPEWTSPRASGLEEAPVAGGAPPGAGAVSGAADEGAPLSVGILTPEAVASTRLEERLRGG